VPVTILGAALALALTLGLGVGAGCSSKRSAKQLGALVAPSWRVALAVPGFGPAEVALPLGATEPRPIALVVHGSVDHPEWQCGAFRGVLGAHVFIVCPRGQPHPLFAGRFTLGNLDETVSELRESLKALKARYPEHVAKGPVLLVGYAEGAAVAAELLRQEPSFFQRVALVNGNPVAVSPSATSIFSKGGGKRVLFLCTDKICQSRAQARATLITRAGAASKVANHEVGPWLDARFTQALSKELPWLLDGDARWLKPRH
jgi:pimeloyl-ACP methyl ester carboxylesterase